jgi:hypothetical protein
MSMSNIKREGPNTKISKMSIKNITWYFPYWPWYQHSNHISYSASLSGLIYNVEVSVENLELFPPLILTLLFSNIRFIIFNCLNNITLDLYRTDISCLGGVFAKNTSLETNFPFSFLQLENM